MTQLIRKVCEQNKRAFLMVLSLNIAVGLMSSISIVMLVPITIFILSQSQILETMASSGLKD